MDLNGGYDLDLDGLNAEHKFWVWVTILGHTSYGLKLKLTFSNNKSQSQSRTVGDLTYAG